MNNEYNCKNGDSVAKSLVTVNTNLIIVEILNFPKKYGKLISQLDRSEKPYALTRLRNRVNEALAGNPPPKRAKELCWLHDRIEEDLI